MEHKLHVKFFFRIVRFLSSIAFFDLLLFFLSFFIFYSFSSNSYFLLGCHDRIRKSPIGSEHSRSDTEIIDLIRSVFRIFDALKYYFFVYIFNMLCKWKKKKNGMNEQCQKCQTDTMDISRYTYGYIYIYIGVFNWNKLEYSQSVHKYHKFK